MNTQQLPKDLAAEKALLGCMLLDNQCIPICASSVKPEMFSSSRHAEIFTVMLTCFDKDGPVDYVTVASRLDPEDEKDGYNRVVYLTELTSDIVSAALFPEYIEIIKRKHALREMAGLFNDGIGQISEASADPKEVIAFVQRKILNLWQSNGNREFRSIEQTMMMTTEKLAEMREEGKIAGIPSGLKSLDTTTCGFMPGDMTIIAGEASVGKTALVLNIAKNAAREGFPVAFMSYEMSELQLGMRLLCDEARISVHKARSGKLAGSDWSVISHALGKLTALPVVINDSSYVDVYELRMQAYQLTRAGKLSLLIVDYLQLAPSNFKTRSREEEIAKISQTLKAIAKDLKIHVIAISSLSREDKLRGSGQVEYDADNIMYLQKPMGKDEGVVDLVIKKQRNGPTCTVHLQFTKETTTFHDLASTDEPNFYEEENKLF